MPDQIDMPPKARQHLETQMIGNVIAGLLIKKLLGVGNTAVTYQVENQYGATWALKLVTTESYGEHAPYTEVSRFAGVKDTRYLVFPDEIGEWTLKLGRKSINFIWFRSRAVIGTTLEKFLQSNTNFSGGAEITRFMTDITIALEELARFGFSHGDLHNRNIMREVVGSDGLSPEIKYVIIDFSEAHPTESVDEGLSNDIENFGLHLRSFSDALYRRDSLSRDDEKILAAISHLPGLLNGVSPDSMGISMPSEILERFKDAYRAGEMATKNKLLTPFESLSTEYIANDALLVKLCFTKMWWTSELEKDQNVLLLGPRGCGKSMIFRRLRLKTKIAAGEWEEIANDRYIGFYIPCESIFFMRFSDLSEVNVETYEGALVLYFNMAILSEVVLSLHFYYSKSDAPMPSSLASSITKLLKDELTDFWEKLNLSKTISQLDELANCAELVMKHVRKSIAYSSEVKVRGSNDFVTTMVNLIKSEVPFFSGKHFTFFLDDYTEERVPLPLQEALHPIVSQRSSELSFKISAHMFGSIYSYPRPLALDEGRNIIPINLGTAYLSLDKRAREGKLLLKILNERFKHCDGYSGTIEEWLGRTSYPGGKTISWALHDKSTREKFKYHGVDCLVDLCTGDYSEMIRMVGKIFEKANIKAGDKVHRIAPHDQDWAIVRVSREHLQRIRHIRPHGKKLFDIIKNFGGLSKNLLYEREPVGQGTTSKGTPRKDPYDLLSIYVDDLQKCIRTYREIWELHQKASIFIDIGVAPSQRNVISDRVTLRRIYCPAFKTTLTSSEHLQLTKKQFEGFIDKPDEFCRNYLKRETDKSMEETLSLWKTEDEEALTMDEEIAGDFSQDNLPDQKDMLNFAGKCPRSWHDIVNSLPGFETIDNIIQSDAEYDLFVGALGFEERTTEAISKLASKKVKVKEAVLLEFGMYIEATGERRDNYHNRILEITGGNPHRPVLAPVSSPDTSFAELFDDLLTTLISKKDAPLKVLFDCTSCPSSIHSQSLAVFLKNNCDLTILYSEAKTYYPTKKEWESGKVRPAGGRIQGPFDGFRFVAKPPTLQADDVGERPVLLIMYPTFNTERTDGVLAYIDPAERVWIFGEPHDLNKNSYRIDMAKSFASPIYCPGDKWTLSSTFDYKDSMVVLGGLYHLHRFNYRIVIMSHGSKMQSLGINLFASIHQVSAVFAMPKSYNPHRYSSGCIEVWASHFGSTKQLVEKLRTARAIGG